MWDLKEGSASVGRMRKCDVHVDIPGSYRTLSLVAI
jgi:hypothetical protein